MASRRSENQNDGQLRFKAVRVAAVLLLLAVPCESLTFPPRLPIHLKRTSGLRHQQQALSREWMGRRKAAGKRHRLPGRSFLQTEGREGDSVSTNSLVFAFPNIRTCVLDRRGLDR